MAVHAVEVLDNRHRGTQVAIAIRTSVAKRPPHKRLVLFAIGPDGRILGDYPAQFVEEHANEFVRDVGLSASRGRP